MPVGKNGFNLGSRRPEDYMRRSYWAADQIELGATEIKCSTCGKWWFHFESHPELVKSKAYLDKDCTKSIEIMTCICLSCHAKRPKGFDSVQDDGTGEWTVKGLNGERKNTNDTPAET